MELSSETLFDVALTVAEYFLAGMLGVVIYTMLARRKTVEEASNPVSALPMQPTSDIEQKLERLNRLQFVKLGEQKGIGQVASNHMSDPHRRPVARRDRSEIVKIARTMLAAGAHPDRIKSVLPISDAELSLLSMQR